MAEQNLEKEAEDVLASIRRLVSHTPEVRAEARLKPAVPADKLVLTPAQRVEEPPGFAEAEPEGVWSLEDRIAELEAAVGATLEEWEPDGSEDADQETPRRFVFQHRPLREVFERYPQADREGEGEAEAEAAAPDVAEPEAAEPEPVAEAPRETVVQAMPRPAPELVAVPEPDAVEESAAPPVDLTGDEEGEITIDEEALREMVAELVRQELQGELGERITRNIRKLVRREIHRALMSRDFD